MTELTAQRVAELSGGRLIGDGDRTASSIVFNHKELRPGAAFAAVGRGYDFIAQALADGAPFAIAEKPAEGNVIVVDDTVLALGRVAKAVRRELDVRVVGITGSVGKTLTKDLLAAVLRTKYNVHASPKSYNQELGAPLVVLNCPDDAEVMVSEMGARHVGDIAYLAEIVQPHTGIITGIGITHLEEFGTREAIARTKSELLASLPADGVAIVPSNDDYLEVLAGSTAARVRTVGPGASVSYRALRVDPDGRTRGVVTVEGRDVDMTLPVAGRALMRNAALAIACGFEHGVDPADAALAIAGAPLSSYRMEQRRIGGWTVINDAYNANPTSVSSALRSVKEMGADRPVWAVLGPMTELGTAEAEGHRRIGRLAADLSYEGVIALDAPGIAEAAGSIARPVTSANAAADAVVEFVPPGALVLVKASRVVSLELFPDILQASLDRAPRMRREGAPPKQEP